ncbi:MAG: MCP four helix bundle domain-containing protein [Thiobacillaceae bacterium]|nr:MCP four helix bundle domain-containing protein [Thiobacillaceae bacterium]
MMRTLIAALGLFGLANVAQANSPDEACAALMEARGHLVSMLGTTDRATQDDLRAKVHAATVRVDAILNQIATSEAAKVNAFRPVWEEFKKTRETEIIPLIYAGKNAEARAIATGIQAERMGKMRAAMGCK